MRTALALLSAVWVAAGPEEWAALHAGKLSSALNRDSEAAAAIHEALLDQLAPDDPMRAEVQLALARTWLEQGQPKRAQQLLGDIDPRSPLAPVARSLQGHLELQARAVNELPTELNLLAEPMPLLSGWDGTSRSLEVLPVTPPTVAWPINDDNVRAAFLAIGIQPGVGRVEALAVEAQTTHRVLALRAVAETTDGRTHVGRPKLLRPGGWSSLRFDLSELTSQPPADGARLQMLAIEVAPVNATPTPNTDARLLLRHIVVDGTPAERLSAPTR